MEKPDNQGLVSEGEGSPSLGLIKRIQKRLKRNPTSEPDSSQSSEQVEQAPEDSLAAIEISAPSITLRIPPDFTPNPELSTASSETSSIDSSSASHVVDDHTSMHLPFDDQSVADPPPSEAMRSFNSSENSRFLRFPSNTSFYSTSSSIPNSMSNSMLMNESSTSIGRDSTLGWLLITTQQLRQAKTIEALLNITVAEVRQHLQVDRVLIFRFQSESQGTVLAESIANGYTPSLKETLPAIAFGAEQPLHYWQLPFVSIEDATKRALTPHQRQLFERFQVMASLCIPIYMGSQLWGLLVVQGCTRPHYWQEAQILLLHQVVAQLQIALQPLESREERQLFDRINDQIRQKVNLSDLSAMVVRDVRKHLGADRVAVIQFCPDSQEDSSIQVVGEATANLPVMINAVWKVISDRVRDNLPLVVNDSRITTSTESLDFLEQFDIQSCAIVPLVQGETLWGALGAFQHSGARQWSSDQIEFLTQISQRLNVALQQADDLMQLHQQTAHIIDVVQLHQSVTAMIPRLLQSQSLETLFQLTNQSVRRLLKCNRATIHRLQDDGSREWLAESVAQGFSSLEKVQLESRLNPAVLMLQENLYRQGKSWVVHNIHTADYTTEEVEYFEELGIQAFVRTPIVKQGALWGILSVYQSGKPRQWTDAELLALQQLGLQVGVALQQIDQVMQVQQLSEQLAQTVQREQLVIKIVERVRQSLDLQQTFRTTAREIRNFLEVDRVAIFKFDAESGYREGETIAEDVQPGYVSALSVKVVDHCFSENFAEMYRKGRVWATADIYQGGLQSCYIDVLSKFQVRANLVVPLLRGDELWGLFCVHHCQDAREWHSTDIEFVKQIAAQLNIAIQQGEYVEQLQRQSEELLEIAEQSRNAKENLQQEVIQLLSAVRPALNGDLTARAPVTDTTVGTIADAYNNTLSSLQQIVMQMQTASTLVAQTSQSSEASLSSLSAQAELQLQSLNQALSQVQRLVHSTQVVETYVQQVQSTVQQANETVMSGDEAIDRTVDEMDKIREIVAEANLRLQRLSESSQKISRIVSVISNFTTQTQLLALNAAIEATRAGEYGRGFAVVADEVRSLARQSADAAVEIEQLVQDIQASTAEVATAMESSSQQVASGTQVVNEARENLNSIVNATSQISELVAHITQVMQEQTLQCQTLTQTMNDVATSANKTSQDSVTISTSFKDLLAMAQDLHAKSNRFRVA
ncbi:GAF domain-containing protein [Thermocoleostomius sinensis]|uniref:GAF domain-containing protein n=1 Tax=Thermocoleostomius sinensis A174 TaxID=2016057 RepID=A0A9E9C5S8_9CYAN|nr:GAF domain-containing protein [Thermocoleostomius sinensis]WAL61486.1 GAF domain-containing protein [Thermocoleostomius sinensis A174]